MRVFSIDPSNLPPPPNRKKYKNSMLNKNYSFKVRYTIGILKRLHEKGLYNEFNYYHGSYQLGRYFKYLSFDEKQVETEIVTWVRRHFKEQCDIYSLPPFAELCMRKIKKPYEKCVEAAVQNCLNGFRNGEPFSEWVRIYPRKSLKYIEGLGYNKRQKIALSNLIDFAGKHSTLNLHLSYYKLLIIFNTTNRKTVSDYLKKFHEDNIFVAINKEERPKRQPTQYRLTLPKNCYKIL